MEGPITRTCRPALLLAAAIAAAIPSLAPLPASAQDSRAISAYVRARAADAGGDADTAVAGYAAALADAPDDQLVAIRTYRQALTVGDLALAARAAAVLVDAGVAPPDTAILGFATALKAGDRAGVDKALRNMREGPLDFMAPVLSAWAALDRGEDALAALEGGPSSAIGRRYAMRHRALLLIAMGRADEGLAALHPMLSGGAEQDLDLRIDAATLLDSTGESRKAKALLKGYQPELSALRKHAKRNPRASVASAGAARLLLGIAIDVAQEDAPPLSVLLTRTALLLDPSDDRARLYLADALSRTGSDRQALAVLAEIRTDSPFARGAAAGAVVALDRAGRTDEALRRARTLAEGKGASSAEAKGYGDLLAASGQYDAAAAAYGQALARAGGKGWHLHYLQGSALDRAGRWLEALPALRRAVELAPDEAQPLTYLGSAQVSRGENLDEAQALLERAVKLSPDDATVADSLAWAYFRRGNVDRALPLLERAAQIDPAGTQVNEHLGDAYWQLGRRYEARYAWKAAAIHADDVAATRLAEKLANGPTPQAN